MKIKDRKETVRNGQKRITGRIELSRDTVLLNSRNQGIGPADYRWRKRAQIVLPKGTEVDYVGQETHSGFWHSISYQTSDGESFCLDKMDANHPCNVVR
jgi:hypothetical protein